MALILPVPRVPEPGPALVRPPWWLQVTAARCVAEGLERGPCGL